MSCSKTHAYININLINIICNNQPKFKDKFSNQWLRYILNMHTNMPDDMGLVVAMSTKAVEYCTLSVRTENSHDTVDSGMLNIFSTS